METVVCKIEGAKGTSTWSNFDGHIECTNVRWGGSRNVRSAMGSDKNRESNVAYMSEISFDKKLDSASPHLTLAFFKNIALGTCLFSYIRTDEGGLAYRSIELEECIMTHYSSHPGPDDRPIEHVSLNFTHVHCKDATSGSQNIDDGRAVATFHLPSGKAS